MPAVDDTSFAAAKSRVETALAFVKSLTRAQVDGAEGKVIAWTAGGNDRKMKGNDRKRNAIARLATQTLESHPLIQSSRCRSGRGRLRVQKRRCDQGKAVSHVRCRSDGDQFGASRRSAT
jgi:hypothetical protein